MTGESDGDLPLHDEAKARSKWRGGSETDDRASETGDGAPGDRDGTGDAERGLKDLAQRPPD